MPGKRDSLNKLNAPPCWDSRSTSYEAYRVELKWWSAYTDIKKTKKGWLVFNSFSQDDPTGVKDKLRIAIENEEVKLEDENSVSQIIGVLDKWFKNFR